jgi:hypothetical protein
VHDGGCGRSQWEVKSEKAKPWEIGMIPKISLTAAFLLMIAPPIACASSPSATNPAPIARQAHESPLGMVAAQNAAGIFERNQSKEDESENGDESDSNSKDNADADQNADPSQVDLQNADGNDQPIPPQVLNGNESAPDSTPQFDQAPQPQPVNPYQ